MTSRSRVLSGFLGAVCGLLLASNGFASPYQPATVQTDHGIPYVSGGVSLDERQTLQQMALGDNVQLVFATKNRDYLSDVNVQILAENGHEVLNVVTQGPWLFTKLPTGRYIIRATTKGQSQGATFTAPARGQARIYLTWNDTILQAPNGVTAKR